jgi:antitoxin Phd
MSKAWKLQDAKARFSEVVSLAEKGKPQSVTRNGKKSVTIIATDEFERLTNPKQNLVEFMRSSPLYGVELDISRDKDETVRDIDIG